MTASPGATPSPTATEPLLRLQVSDPPHPGPVAGAWWPRSRDLAAEATTLVDGFPASIGRVSRILYSTPDWDAPARRIPTRHGTVKAGTFPRDDTHVVVLRLSDHRALTLLVVPAGTPPAAASAAMDSAADALDGQDAHSLLGLSAGADRVH